MKKPEGGSVWRHYKNNKLYCVCASVKIQVEGEWVPGVLYLASDDAKAGLFARTREEFLNKFTEVGNE